MRQLGVDSYPPNRAGLDFYRHLAEPCAISQRSGTAPAR